ncbi:NAD-dependent dehydratase [Pandoraea terrae]|uniref:NAD-dependent dehydratase n=1 Tax=Pandoraea terrae TaxID=1537710 RepID=A0A5E4XJF5_9BURK|nr:NAD(P)-dependent oxidoreductase [Pandoraea terrae]VVE36424.1 NAD-dependent dehydratase [Pandoraea terrae]
MTSMRESDPKPFRRLLLTGAGGNLGRQVRPALGQWAEYVRVSDIISLGEAAAHEEVVFADLSDESAVQALMHGVDAVVHLGGISVEAPFPELLEANIRGTYHLYAAAQAAGVRRIVYASSNHVTGFYPTTQVIDTEAPVRPDCLYGVTKCFGEALSRYYFDRFGLETVCLRIGSSFEAPRDARMLVTYLSFRDFIEAVRCSLFAPRVGHSILYGVSDNRTKWWDNRHAAHLGFRAQDSSIPFESQVPPAQPCIGADDIAQRYQGGTFVLAGPMASKR